jgi:hypothetical protein
LFHYSNGARITTFASKIYHYHNHKREVKKVLATKSNETFVNGKEELERLEGWRDICEKHFSSTFNTQYFRHKMFKEYASINQFLKTA